MGRLIFSKLWPLIKVLVIGFKFLPSFMCSFIWGVTSCFSGSVSVLIRYLIFSSRVGRFSKNTYIGTCVVLKNLEGLHVGKNLSIHDFCYIDAVGKIIIGDNVSIAHGCSLVSFNHTWAEADTSIKYNPVKLSPIVIQDDVWIGCGVRIMPGVEIGSRSIVAAGSVVLSDVPSHCVVAGVPAKVVKHI